MFLEHSYAPVPALRIALTITNQMITAKDVLARAPQATWHTSATAGWATTKLRASFLRTTFDQLGQPSSWHCQNSSSSVLSQQCEMYSMEVRCKHSSPS